MINDDGFDIEMNMQQALEKTKDMQSILPQDICDGKELHHGKALLLLP